MADAVALRLHSRYDPADGAHGAITLRLANEGTAAVAFERLAITTIVQLTPTDPTACHLALRVSGYHELAPISLAALEPGEAWASGTLACGHPLGHANDGPASAFVIHADGSTSHVPVERMERDGAGPARTPEPAHVHEPPRALRLDDPCDATGPVWDRMGRCEQAAYGEGALVLDTTGDPVTVVIDEGLDPDGFRLSTAGAGFLVHAGGQRGLQHALVAATRLRRGETTTSVAGPPVHPWRVLQIDAARQFIPPDQIGELIDLAAWHRLNRLHLHLTDDEGWRVPIAAQPALTEIGGWRGHGLPIPPLLGTGAEPTGGAYTAAEIAAWVGRAGELGIDVIPEIDLPGHSFAALAALPRLRDPDDASGARSVQHFVDNVLNPGVTMTMPFLEAVLGEVADLFPGAWIHLGGDEVPNGAWSGSPAAARYAAARGIGGAQAIGAAFLRDIVSFVTLTLGRKVGVWQEAAECGALQPGEGYVVGWKSNDDCRRLAAAGHDVVASPAEAYYFDMAEDDDWWSPGTSWAGSTSVADVERFDVTAGWDDAERERLLGVQACLWTEHVHDRTTMRRLLLPRLGAFADRCWPG